MRNKGNRLWISWSGFLVVLILWQAVSSFGLVEPTIFPGPLSVIRDGFTEIPATRLLEHIAVSTLRVIVGFLTGLIGGVALGIACGWYRTLGSILRAPIELIRPIPPLAWISLMIIWLGIGEPPKIVIIFLGAFFPIFTNTLKGMQNIDTDFLYAGRMLGVDGPGLLRKVAFPAILPDIATGVRVGWSYAYGTMVAAELIAADTGLGALIMKARSVGQISLVMFGIMIIGVLNLITDYLIQNKLISKGLRWAQISSE